MFCQGGGDRTTDGGRPLGVKQLRILKRFDTGSGKDLTCAPVAEAHHLLRHVSINCFYEYLNRNLVDEEGDKKYAEMKRCVSV